MTALEALGRNTMTDVEAPPAEDAAFFDALAEYDRLAAVSQNLERRKEVIRPGIPEAMEADKAYEATCRKASAASSEGAGYSDHNAGWTVCQATSNNPVHG